jgi:hypothetical protein
MLLQKIASLILILGFGFGTLTASDQFSAKIKTPTTLKANDWNEISIIIQNPSDIKNVKFYMSLPDAYKTKLIAAAKGSFDHAFNAIRVDWAKLESGNDIEVKFKVFIPEQTREKLLLRGIFSYTLNGQLQKFDLEGVSVGIN